MKKVSPDQATLRLIQFCVRIKRFLHLGGALLENLQQIPMAAFEVLENLGELSIRGTRFQPKYPFDDMVGPGLVCGI